MADIAMYVAEEYERIRSLKGIESEAEMINLTSYVSNVALDLNGLFNRVHNVTAEKKLQFAAKVLEPKTSVGMAAINGFFSA